MNIIDAARRNKLEIVKRLIKEGHNVNSSDKYGNALMGASFNGNLEIVKELIKSGANVNQTDGHHWTALMSSSLNNRIEIVKEFIQCPDIDIYIAYSAYNTALMYALEKNHVEIVKIIKDKMIEDINKILLLPYDIVHKIVMEML